MKKALVCGAGGFIGHHLVRQLKREGYYVVGADLKNPEFGATAADEFYTNDLRLPVFVKSLLATPWRFDEIYQLAADMGGWQHVFSGDHDADIMHNSALINLNILHLLAEKKWKGTIFYSSSACIYPQELQNKISDNQFGLKESDAYPANPDSPYGWEKLFSEKLYECFHRNYGIDIRIARFHNIFGPEGTYDGGRQKAPADICRQVAQASYGGCITLMGDGQQQRSFLYIDECIEGVRRLMASNYTLPINIGSDEIISINDLAKMVAVISGKVINITYQESNALGVRQRNSDNTLIKKVLGWAPSASLYSGMEKTYGWINEQVHKKS
jgi:nucleoside-diphosphate-sugar epimerase